MNLKLHVLTFMLFFLGISGFSQGGPGGFSIGDDEPYLNPQKYRIASTVITGVDYFQHDAIRLISGLTPGKEITIPGDDISNAIKKLWDQDLFSNVEIYYEPLPGKEVRIEIKLEGRPKLTKYKFTQNGEVSKGEAEKIRDIVDLYAGKTITENLKKNTENQIRGFYQEKGFLRTKVTITEIIDTSEFNARIFEITVNKGEKIKIDHITFHDNELDESVIPEKASFIKRWSMKRSVSDGGLRKAMKDTKQKGIMRIFSRSKFNQTAYERDKVAILERYNAVGLRDARIVSDTVYNHDSTSLGIDIYIDQGEMYYFGDITWVGNTKYSSGLLDTVLGINYGDPFNKALLEQRLYMSMDGRDITSLYMDRGYLFFNVTPVEMYIDDNNYIHYEMRIQEGKEARVGKVIVQGNTKTNDHVILREIRTKPGDLFNRNDIIRTQRELANLGYFDAEQLGVNPIPNPQNGTVDIIYTVVEKSSDQVELSGGFGAGRLIGTLGLSFNNFSTKNFFTKEAWQPLPSGDGQRLSIRGQTFGRGFQSYNLSFTEPWLGGKKPNSLTVFGSYSLVTNALDREDPSFSKTGIFSVGVGLGTRLKWPDDYFQAYSELNYQQFDLLNPQFYSLDEGVYHNISLKFVLSRNSVSQPLYPRSGSNFTLTTKFTLPYSMFDQYENSDYASLSQQELHKYAEYYKIKFTGEWYFPLSSDEKLVLKTRFGFGFLGAYNSAKGPTPFERYYLGGSGLNGTWQFDGRELIALRGYDGQSEVSPLTGATVISKYTMELRYPLSLNPNATIYGLAFLEAGNTYNGFSNFDPFNVKRSAGVGVRIFLPMFGLLGVDFGWGFDPLDPYHQGFGGGNDPGVQGPTFTLFPIIGMSIGDL